MRLVNDREENSEQSELGFFHVAAHAMLTALGIWTVFFGPLPMIFSFARFADPWPKITALLGAAIALTVLEVPLSLVVICFVFGLYVADGVSREVALWRLLANATLLAGVAGLGTLLVSAQVERHDLVSYWTGMIDSSLSFLKANIHGPSDIHWDLLRGVFLYEGPFLFLSAAVLSLWFSIGLAAHVGLFGEEHAYSATGLRKVRLPSWVGLLFVGLFILTFSGAASRLYFLARGLFRLVGSLLFIQGCICLSEIMARRVIRPRVRTLVYSVFILLGFYAVTGMGLISPWFQRNKQAWEEAK
jgi:hypothetical protein